MTIETKIFERGNVLVSNSRFVIGNSTYPVRNISYVKSEIQKPKRLIPALSVFLGVAMVLISILTISVSTNGLAIGIGLIMLGAFFLVTRKTLHNILIHTNGGNVKAVSSPDGKLVAEILAALNSAIVSHA